MPNQKGRPLIQRQQLIGIVVGGLVLITFYINYRILFDEEKREQLIFDIGFSTDAIEAYLLAGHKVVGISSNPLQVIAAQELFQAQIIQSKLILINAGIEQHDHEQSGGRSLSFWVHKTNRAWSSFNPSEGCRIPDGEGFDLSLCSRREVETTSCSNLVKTYGLPHYLRIHSDGKDWMCLESLNEVRKKPKYISIEAKEVEWLAKLRELGYKKYKVVHHETMGYSAYGDSAMDFKQKSNWRTYEDVVKDWPYFTHEDETSWHWHATK